MSSVLPLVTERLELRPLRLGDAPVLFRDVYGDQEVMRWVAAGVLADLPATEAAIQRFIAHQRSHGFSWWAVVERATAELIGDAGLYSDDAQGPGIELGYTLARRAWGRGYATEAAVASLQAAFGAFGVERVTAVVRPENRASRRVLTKAGMHPDGTTRYFGHEHLRFAAERVSWRRP